MLTPQESKMEENYTNIEANALSICDMRPGFTQDEVELTLPSGEYAVSTIEIGSLQGFQLLLKERSIEKEEMCGSLPLDGACVGLFDKQGFLNYFQNDFEAIYEWSSDKAQEGKTWKNISHDAAGSAFYFQIFSDCTCEVFLLYSKDSVVGLKVMPYVIETNKDKKREWTWVNIQCKGIYQELNICHDRNHEIELEEVIEDVLSDLCAIETEDTLGFIDESSVDISAPIISFRSDFKGIKSADVVYEKSIKGNRTSKRIQPNVESLINNIGLTSTTEDLGKFIYEIFKMAEKMS